MYEYAAEVLGWVAAGQSVGVARVVAVRGFSGVGLGDIAVAGPTGARLGGVLGGAADGEVRALLAQSRERPEATWVAEVAVSDGQARSAGLLCGGSATILVQPAVQIPRTAWAVLAEREPICLVTDLSGPEVGRTTWFTLESLATGHDAAVGGGPARHVPGVVGLFGHGAAGTAITLLPRAPRYWSLPCGLPLDCWWWGAGRSRPPSLSSPRYWAGRPRSWPTPSRRRMLSRG